MTPQNLLDRFDLLLDTPDSVPKLRKFILQLALRGRLTENDPEDPSADVLLQKIQEERQRRYDSGKWRRPRADIEPVNENDIPHDLPRNWKWISFGQVFDYKGGSQPPKSDFINEPAEGYVRLYQIRDLGDEGDDPVPTFVPEESVSNYMTQSDILIGRYGASVGKILRGEKGTYNVALVKIQYPKDLVESDYVYHLLRSQYFQEPVTKLSRSAQAGFNKKNLFPIPLPLPPLEEQQRIVQTVDGLMDECDALEEQQEREHALQVQVGTSATEALQSADDAEALRPAWERVREHFDTVTATPEGVDALRQTILQLAVQGRFTERNTEDKPASELVRKSSVEIQELYDSGKITKPSERPPVREGEKVFNLPDKWTWTRLGNVLALVNGRAYKKSELLDEGTPVIRIQNLTGGGSWYYTDLDLPPEKYCNTGDLLYTWSGTFGPHIWNGGKAVFHYHIWRIELTTGLTKQFAYHLLQAISADVEEDAHGIMLPHMTKGGMEKHPVPLPPLAEQKRIVETLDRLLPLFDRLSENVNQKSKRGEQLLKAALERASADQQDTVATGMAA